MKLYQLSFVLIFIHSAFAQAPVVENVRFEQRTDGSLLVDIYYDVSDVDDDALYIKVVASDNDGDTWDVPCKSLLGDFGNGIAPDTNKHVIWDFYADNPDTSGIRYRVGIEANDDLCGLTLTHDLTLLEDLECEPLGAPAINIVAPNVTLDLGGYTIYGDWSTGTHEAIIAENVDDVTIRNGTIDRFTNSIILAHSSNSIVEDITITNLENDDAEIFVSGIILGGSQNIIIRDCQFEFLYAHHKQAISMGNSNATIDNIELNGGSVGVDLGGNLGFTPSSGTVINSRFIHNIIGGILGQYCDSVRVANNYFEQSNITFNPAYEATTRRITIDGNEIHDTGEAIWFLGITESTISNNTISNSLLGISIDQSKGCIHNTDEWDCFYSTNNVISNNIVLGNNLDLYHHDLCTGNIWEGNIAESKHGAEIYSSFPVMAGEFLSTVDSVATSIVADAQLLNVTAGDCDTTGESYKWVYIYHSESQDSDHELWFHDGQALDRGTPPFPSPDDAVPFSGPWIDSDSALVIADSLGGREFKEAFELDLIQMGVQEYGWTVFYIAQDTVFRAEFSALIE